MISVGTFFILTAGWAAWTRSAPNWLVESKMLLYLLTQKSFIISLNNKNKVTISNYILNIIIIIIMQHTRM